MKTRSPRRGHRPIADERGQAIIVMAFAMVILIGALSFAIDVGHVLSVRRALQASTDAAATAGAQVIGEAGQDPLAVARQYSAETGRNNARAGLTGVVATTSVVCRNFIANLLTQSSCVTTTNPPNTMVVTQTAPVRLFFGSVIGFPTMTVRTTSTAGMSGGAATPLDIVIVLDATWSMSLTCSGTAMSKMSCAKDGIRTLLSTLWPCKSTGTCTVSSPVLDQVGLVVFPPAISAAVVTKELDCAVNIADTDLNYDNAATPTVDPNYFYTIAPIANDYKTSYNSALNESSTLLKAVALGGCGLETPPGSTPTTRYSTSFATAIEKAQAMLDTVNASNGRDKAQDVIIVLGDGGANYGPSYYGDASSYRRQPCQTAINIADGYASSKKTWIYSVAYDAEGNCVGWDASDGNGGTNRFSPTCFYYGGAVYGTCHPESPTITALNTMRGLASDSSKFYQQPSSGELLTVFRKLAADLMSTRMIDDGID